MVILTQNHNIINEDCYCINVINNTLEGTISIMLNSKIESKFIIHYIWSEFADIRLLCNMFYHGMDFIAQKCTTHVCK